MDCGCVYFFVLSPRTCFTFSIEPLLYSLLTENPARGGVSLNDRLGCPYIKEDYFTVIVQFNESSVLSVKVAE